MDSKKRLFEENRSNQSFFCLEREEQVDKALTIGMLPLVWASANPRHCAIEGVA